LNSLCFLNFATIKEGGPDQELTISAATDRSDRNRGFTHRNYYYLCTQVSHHQFTLWAIPVGKSCAEAPTWFLLATPDKYRRWKVAALPFELIQKIEPIPPKSKLAVLGLIEQTPIDLRNQSNDVQTAPSRRQRVKEESIEADLKTVAMQEKLKWPL
jgi:hypothetical protein